ncbi:DUF5819 family protein [Streptomyces sp. 8N616]|uniref:DUF5819 family protein n=1 Tax=Streptomyces sp. 8N616 TaxID=3457414 RepID=UPI003FD0E65B
MLVSAGVVLMAAALFHLAMLFLSIAPANSITTKYQEKINGYVLPEFLQGWQLFAPNPLQESLKLEARVRMASGATASRTTPWVNISARDTAAVTHNPFPSHVHQNVLRRAWDFYNRFHNYRDGRPIGIRGELSEAHLKRIGLQRLGLQGKGDGHPVGIQFRITTIPVPPPKWSAEKDKEKTVTRLPWWPVQESDRRGL